jgi:hypothetical protein
VKAKRLEQWTLEELVKSPDEALRFLKLAAKDPEVLAALKLAVSRPEVREEVQPYALGCPQMHQVREQALLMRLRARFKQDGLHFRRSGRDRTARAAHGSWYAINDAGRVKRSAARDGRPDETLRELAQRIGLLAAWEK